MLVSTRGAGLFPKKNGTPYRTAAV